MNHEGHHFSNCLNVIPRVQTYLSLTALMELMFENSTCDWPRSRTHREEPEDNSSEFMKCDLRMLRLLR